MLDLHSTVLKMARAKIFSLMNLYKFGYFIDYFKKTKQLDTKLKFNIVNMIIKYI